MAEPKVRQPRLGKGLSSLMGRAVEVALPHRSSAASESSQASTATAVLEILPASRSFEPPPGTRQDGLTNLPIASIRPNPHQPRQHFDPATLEQLAASIRSAGLMQPVIVRPVATPKDGDVIRYELVAGERRWRAAHLVGLSDLPAIVRLLDDRQLAEWAIIENLQREDLNPIDRAEAFQRLVSQFDLSHDDIAARVGLDRSSISNSLRLLGLCGSVRQLVREGRVSAGQAKVLAGVTNPQQQTSLAHQAVKQEWSVRRLEQTTRLLAGGGPNPAPETPSKSPALSPHLADLEQQIGQQLGTRAKIRRGRKKGTGSLTIEFHSIDQFDALLAKLGIVTE